MVWGQGGVGWKEWVGLGERVDGEIECLGRRGRLLVVGYQ